MVIKKGLIISLILGLFLIGSVLALPSSWSVSITSPSNNGMYATKINNIDWSYSGINRTEIFNVWYDINGVISNFPGYTDPDTTMTIGSINSLEGNNTCTVYVNRTSSEIKSSTITFWVDSIAPVLNYNSPTSELTYTNQNTLFFSSLLNEQNKGYYWGQADKFFSLQVNNKYGTNFYSNVLDIDSLTNLSTQDSVDLIAGNKYEGDYTWIVFAKDVFPNGDTIREVNLTGTIIRDTIIPSLTISSPTSTMSDVAIHQIIFSASDTNLDYCNFTDGLILQTINCLNPFSFDSVEGNNTWTVEAYDKAGNVNQSSVLFFVDSLFPNIKFEDETTSEGFLSQNWIFVNISANDTYLDTVRINLYNTTGIERSVSNSSSFATNFTGLADGIYQINASANDSIGHINYTEETRTIILDTTNPLILYGNGITEGNSTSRSIFVNVSITETNFDSVSFILQGKTTNTTIYSSPINSILWSGLEDGDYSYYVYINDSAGNENQTDEKNVTIDATAPSVNVTSFNPIIISPENQDNQFDNLSIDFSFTEFVSTVLFVENSEGEFVQGIYSSNRVKNPTTKYWYGNDSSGNFVDDGSYYIKVNMTDDFGNSNNSILIGTVIVDNTSPIISLNGTNPLEIELGSNYIELNASASDSREGDLTNRIVINSSSVNTSQVGTYNVTYIVEDSVKNRITEMRTINVVDTTNPDVNLILQEDNEAFEFGSDIYLEFNSTDLSAISNCTLLFEGAINETFNLINQSINYNVTLSNLNAGRYNWTIECRDVLNNLGESETRFFTVLSNITFDDNTTEYTNLTNEADITNVSYFFIANQYGMVNWTNPIDFSAGTNWANCVNISFNKTEVNSSCFPGFNTKAQITLYNLIWTNPQVLREGSICTDCVEISYNSVSGEFIFNVTGFSIYETRETPVETVVTNNGGGGGGGSSTLYYKCSVWGEWSQCNNEQQTRTCSEEVATSYENREALSQTQSCDSSSEETGNNENNLENQTGESAGFFSRLTGAITGATVGTTGRKAITLTVTVLLILAGAYFGVRYFRTKY